MGESNKAMLPVLLESYIVWSGAQHLRQLAACCATKEIHLPEAIARRDVSLREIEVLIIFRFDVRNATFVSANRDFVAQPTNLNRFHVRFLVAGLMSGDL